MPNCKLISVEESGNLSYFNRNLLVTMPNHTSRHRASLLKMNSKALPYQATTALPAMVVGSADRHLRP